jgi:hypothetical protein
VTIHDPVLGPIRVGPMSAEDARGVADLFTRGADALDYRDRTGESMVIEASGYEVKARLPEPPKLPKRWSDL